MKRQTSKRLLQLLPLAVGLVTITSCKKVFDLEPKNAVDQSQMYRNVYDADAAVIGIYGKVMTLAKPYMLLNELRGDLMDITANSDQYLRELSEHNVTDKNPYYNVIVNCNDVLKNFLIMKQTNKMKEDEFKQRYSDVGAIRSWVYLQLGIHFGRIPYVTDPLAQVSDLHDQSKFPMIDLGPLIDSLVKFTEALPFLENYPAGTNLQTVVDGYPTSNFFINKNMFLGDLYLWQGQYNKAADRYKKVMEVNGTVGESTQFYNQYKVSNGAIAPPLASISYARALDFSSLNYDGNSWRNLFQRSADVEFNYEWMWALPFDKNFEPQNPFMELFSPAGGSYLVKPSQQAMDYWNSQTQTYQFAAGTVTFNATTNVTTITPAVYRDNFPFDSRGVFTYKMINGQPVIMKFLYNYLGTNNLPVNVFSKQGKWFLSRTASLHLHFAEAANRAGNDKIAYALTNRGIAFTYDPFPGAPTNRDVSNIHQTFLPPPYDFDARFGEAPRYRAPWYRNQGIRGRAGLKEVPIDSARYFNMSVPAPRPLTDAEGLKNAVEDIIIAEDALELAYEGERWPDLLRVAIRRNNPAFIADKIYNKLLKSGLSSGAASQARAKLMSKNWFLPFKW
jgi:starch-binding outer membrane protein, SusD/RagB family